MCVRPQISYEGSRGATSGVVPGSPSRSVRPGRGPGRRLGGVSRAMAILLAWVGVGGPILSSGLPAQVGSPAGPVPVPYLEARRAALLEALDGRAALFGSAGLRSIEGDYPQDSDFRQDNDLFYLTGVEVPGAWLALNTEGSGSVVLYLPERDESAEVWTGPRMGPGPLASEVTGIRQVRPTSILEGDLRRSGATARGPLVFSAGDGANEAWLRQVLGAGAPLRAASPLMARLRLVKDDEELRRMRRAIDLTIRGIEEAWRVAEPGVTEYELEAVVEFVFRRGGAERVGFPSIVGSGPNSTVLHYDRSRRRTQAGDLVVMDVGAEFGYYSADITRTFPVTGRFTPRQRELYDLVLGAQQAALDLVRPGVTIDRLAGAARAYMDRHSGRLCGSRSCSRYFVHGLSHWLGMDVHDVGDYGTPLAPGMVITVEPGVYIPHEGIGIRIEDDVLITADGYELLTGALPRAAADVEASMARAPTLVRRAP